MTSSPSPISDADQIDLICDDFETAWKNGEFPDLIEFVNEGIESTRSSLFNELLLVEMEYRKRRGESPELNLYKDRFPEFAAELESIEFRIEWNSAVRRMSEGMSIGPSGQPPKFSRFELLCKLGEGASGEVWKARDIRLQRLVALKIPKSPTLRDQEFQRFLREARSAARLRHANIIGVHEACQENGVVYIVSDYVEGRSLRELLAAESISASNAAEICALLAEALDYAHRAGVVHRDLKPANVIVDGNYQPHIIDFGLAKLSDGHLLTHEGDVLGTPAYMSPEQARGQWELVDAKSDIYSLGIILYEVLAGESAFCGAPVTVLRAAIQDDPRPLREIDCSIPRELETICGKAIEKLPSNRYATAQEFAVDLRRFLRGEPIHARRTGSVERVWRWARRRPALIASLLLLLIAAASICMAVGANRKAYELLGHQKVLVETNPPNAKLAFLPLNRLTGVPDSINMIPGVSKTPVNQDLLPGDYLIVAVLPNGRFHEVYRHVPEKSEGLPESHAHRRFGTLANGTIRLPLIQIPTQDVTDNMAFIEGSNQFVMGKEGRSDLPRHHQPVRSFFMAPNEFTVGDFQRLNGYFPRSMKASHPSQSYSCDYDWAVAYLEGMGMRLPTEAEYEFAATARGHQSFSWGDVPPDQIPKVIEGDLSDADFDRLSTQPPIRGLCSNKAEWTSSWAVSYPNSTPAVLAEMDLRVVRGGNQEVISGNPTIDADARDPRERTFVPRTRRAPGLSFRGVRSSLPIISYDDLP